MATQLLPTITLNTHYVRGDPIITDNYPKHSLRSWRPLITDNYPNKYLLSL